MLSSVRRMICEETITNQKSKEELKNALANVQMLMLLAGKDDNFFKKTAEEVAKKWEKRGNFDMRDTLISLMNKLT